jgi:hypothetical protein
LEGWLVVVVVVGRFTFISSGGRGQSKVDVFFSGLDDESDFELETATGSTGRPFF